MRGFGVVAALIILLGSKALGQTPASGSPDSSQNAATPRWEYSASVYTYFVPHSQALVNPNFTADRGRLHLEGRYNFEARRVGSAWVGVKVKAGSQLVLEATPMLGGVFGSLNGMSPGLILSLSYKRFSIFSQSEYVFDFGDRSKNFFYNWNEFGYSPKEWLRAGIVTQRTRAYQTDLDVQRGLFAAVSVKGVDITAYVLNFGWTDPTVVAAIAYKF